MGREGGRARRALRARRERGREPRGDQGLGRDLCLGPVARRGPGDDLLDFPAARDRGSVVCADVLGGPLPHRAGDDEAARRGGGGLRHRQTPRLAAAAARGGGRGAGATIEPADVALLLPWLDWAWDEQRQAAKAA